MTPEQFAEHLTRSPISERSLAIEWIRITARDDYLDDASARREILAILAGLDLVEHGPYSTRPRLCAHADDGRKPHWLAPGETCPDAEKPRVSDGAQSRVGDNRPDRT